MDILTRIIIFLCVAPWLTGCYCDFEPDIRSTPVLCMNSTVTAGEQVRVELTRTWRYDEGSPGYDMDITVTAATVRLTINDGEPETLILEHTDNGWPQDSPFYEECYLFVSHGEAPRPGDRIRLEAVSRDYGDAAAEVTVPLPVAIDRLEPVITNLTSFTDYDGVKSYRFDLEILTYFTDPGMTTDYYKLDIGATPYRYADSGDGFEGISMWYLDLSREPLFTEHVSTLESVIAETSGYTIFTDRQINGKTYPLHIKAKDVHYRYYNPDNDPGLGDFSIIITLNSISPSYYNHVLSVWQTEDGIVGSLGGVGLGEAVTSYSNVSSGAGIVAARSSFTVGLPLLPLVSLNAQK